MWHFTPERLTLGLSARHAVLGIVARTARLEQWVPAPTAGAAASPLDIWLKQQPVARKRVDITVSNACAHHLLVPRNGAVAHYRERDGYARAMLEEAYGLDAAAWHIAADDDPFTAQFLTVGIPRPLLANAQAGLAGARARRGSVQTFFTREWNAHRNQIGTKPSWFAVIEPACTVLARVQRGRLALLRTLRGALASGEELVQAVEREALATLLEDTPKTIFIAGEALFAQAARTVGAFTLRRLDAVTPAPFIRSDGSGSSTSADRTVSRLLWNA